MDVLSDLLSRLRLQSYRFVGLCAGGDWALAFGSYEGVKVYAVTEGECWLALDGAAVHLEPGDAVLLPSGRPFRLAGAAARLAGPADTIAPTPSGGIAQVNGGGPMFIAGGHFTLAGNDPDLLLAGLPPVVHLSGEAERATLHWCVERLRQELPGAEPGGFLIAQLLCTVMLVQALRLHLAREPRGGGWLSALADRRLAAAIAAMHDDPARRWTVSALAARAGMSRTGFAVGFKAAAGVSPIEHLTRWRMLLACDRLSASADPVSAIARASGYESESAFSHAFKQVTGCSPRSFRNRQPPLGGSGRMPSNGPGHASTTM